MAATCVVLPATDALENAYRRQRILRPTTGWAEKPQNGGLSEVRTAATTNTSTGGGQNSRRYALHQLTANSPLPTNPTPTSRNPDSYTCIQERVSVLVAQLLQALAPAPASYGSSPAPLNEDEWSLAFDHDEALARACVTSDSSAPVPRRNTPQLQPSKTRSDMDFNIDFGSTAGFKSHARKKKPATKQFDPWPDENEEKKDDGAANGSGGGDGIGGGNGDAAGGAGGGGDDNNGGNDDDDAWGFTTGKKNKKKNKKKLEEEEEEEERKRKEEEEAKAAPANPDPLSWADDVNGDAANEDWTMSWGGTKKKDKKKKDNPPAVPDAPPATSAFQDISLDDPAPKLDFSFDGLGDSKKEDSGGFSAWGKSWDFGGVGKTDGKKEETSDFGTNNPWGMGGSKTKKKTTTLSNFEFGDFESSNNNDLSFAAAGDVTDTKPADDAWGFANIGKKDKKKKGAIEEIKEEPAPIAEEKEEDTWGTWGTAKKGAKTKKKSAFDDAFSGTTAADNAADASFDWGFGSKDKKNDLTNEVEEKPATKEDDGDDWMSGAWGAAGKKKNKKKADDLSASIDLTSNAENKTTDPPADDSWAAFSTTKKDKKKTKKSLLDDEFLPEAPEPPTVVDLEPETSNEPLVAWDTGLGAKEKRKKEKQMRLEGTWDSRVTQEMVDAAEAQAGEPAADHAADPAADPEPEPVPPPPIPPLPSLIDAVPWDHGLSPVKKRKKEKEMRLEGTWDDRITQDMIDAAKEAAEAAPEVVVVEDDPAPEPEQTAVPEIDSTPLEDLVPWDYMLTSKDKRKKEKELRANGEWDDRLTQDKIDQMIADRDAAAAAAPDPEPEPHAAPEAAELKVPFEDLVPWDHGLTSKERRRKEKEMKLDGTWEDRLTQEIIDEKKAAAETAKDPEPEPEPEPEQEPEAEPEPEPAAPNETLEELELLVPWDHGLKPKEKKKKQSQMQLDGTWDDRLTQEKIDEKIAAAKAAAAEPDPEPELEPEPAPEPVEERKPWDHGLSKLEKKRKEKQMKLDGTWDDRLTQEKIDEEAATAVVEPDPAEPPEPGPEPRLPWDYGLTSKEKKKKEKQMKLDNTWDDRLTQEKIDLETAAAADKATQLEPEPEPPGEEGADNGWSFGWGSGKSKSKKNSLLDPTPEKVEEKADDGWSGGWGFGLGKDKKKKAGTPPAEEPEPEPEPEPVPEPEPAKAEKVDDIWGFASSAKDKKKKDKGVKKSDLFEPVVEDTPLPSAPAEDDIWAPVGKSDKKATKKGKKATGEEPPADPEPAAIPSLDDFSWGGLDTGKKTKSPIEETPAKKSASSLWGFGSSSSTAKSKKDKEAKEKKEAEEEAAKAEVDRLAAEETSKSAKKSKAGKLTPTTSKTEEKKSDDLLVLLDDSVTTPKSSSSKLRKTSTRNSDNKLEDVPEEKDDTTTDYFGFWGSSKKTAGKKGTDNKKEIKSSVLTNEEDALLAELNEDEIQAILDDTPAPPSPKITKTMSNGKTKASSSVADRVKALETNKEDAGKKSKAVSAALNNEEAEAEATLTPKELKKAAKGKTSAKLSKNKIDQPPSPLDEAEQKKSKDSVPGSFPAEDLLVDEPLPSPEPESSKPAKKGAKVEKKTTKASSSSKKKSADVTFDKHMDIVIEPDPAANETNLLGDEPAKLPTPPPEKSTKKERPRVERSATSSWGFWGASAPPKKATRSRTVDDVSPPSSKTTKSPPALTRSKSTRSSKYKEADDGKETEKASKTSGSDKEGSAKQSDRAKPSRGMSFANYMLGGAPPSAMRNGNMVRRSSTTGSKSSSRRQSMVDSGLISPPPDDGNPITSKAARLMGYTDGKPVRRSSTKEKSKSYADPYPIDDDDMVMIQAKDKDAEPIPKAKLKNKIVTSAKRSSTKPRSKTLSGDEDVVMVDSPIAMDSPNEDFDKPALQRSNTTRSSTGFFGKLFGGGSRTPVERTRSTPATDNEDNVPASRSRADSRRRSRVMSPADDFTTDAPGETDADVAARRAERRAKRAAAEKAEEDERLARERRRRERRDREKADLEARRERAREQARKDREAEEQRKEERRARRREKEATERARHAQEEAEAEAAAERRREERKKLREQLEADAAVKPLSKDDRRRSYAGEEELRRRRRDESGKSHTKSGRRSTALMAEYHESRSGSGRGIKPPEDKTSSWVASQNDEPPDAPPLEPTVLDESGQLPRPVDDADTGTKRRRKDKYAGMTEEDIAVARAKRRERRVVEKSTSGGSDEKVQRKASSRRQSKVYDDDYYADPVRTFDGRPQQSKRSSFLGKFF